MPSMSSLKVPKFDLTNSSHISTSAFEKAYHTHQAIHIRGFNTPASNPLVAADILSLFQSLNDQDKASWCIENKSNSTKEATASEFLDSKIKCHRGYCSFLVQHSDNVMRDLMSRLPLVDLPTAESSSNDRINVKYGPCIWFFFGKNYGSADEDASSQQPLLGRPEHTDSVSHDGTWHYQLSGTKIWRIRPTDDLMDRIQQSSDGANNKKQKLNDGVCRGSKNDGTIEVECKQGDILLLNTRLWWHSTVIPVQDTPSISYARDVYFQSDLAAGAAIEEINDVNESSHPSTMTNVDGTYAAQDIEAETILFTEHTMPDCELHRSKTNPNCQVVELEDEAGESYMAVVSLRDIKAGEFFCVMESDSEQSDDSEEEEDWEEDVCRPIPE